MRTSVRLVLSFCALAAAAAALACGYDGDDGNNGTPATPTTPAAVVTGVGGITSRADPADTPIPTSVNTPRPVPTSNPALEPALVPGSELGAGWQGPGVGSGATAADTFFCGEQVANPPTGAVGVYQEVTGDRRNFFVAIGPYATADEAAAYIEAVRSALRDCTTMVSTDGRSRTEWNVSAADFKTYGDESFTTLARTTVGGERASSYSVLIRVGSTIVAATTLQSGDTDRAAAEALVDAAFAHYVETTGG